jgi:hypothetical protein
MYPGTGHVHRLRTCAHRCRACSRKCKTGTQICGACSQCQDDLYAQVRATYTSAQKMYTQVQGHVHADARQVRATYTSAQKMYTQVQGHVYADARHVHSCRTFRTYVQVKDMFTGAKDVHRCPTCTYSCKAYTQVQDIFRQVQDVYSRICSDRCKTCTAGYVQTGARHVPRAQDINIEHVERYKKHVGHVHR